MEHISARCEAGLDGDSFTGAFGLSGEERVRLAEYRRLAAFFWLLVLRPGRRASGRNPAGTRRQAERLLALL